MREIEGSYMNHQKEDMVLGGLGVLCLGRCFSLESFTVAVHSRRKNT